MEQADGGAMTQTQADKLQWPPLHYLPYSTFFHTGVSSILTLPSQLGSELLESRVLGIPKSEELLDII